MFNFKDSGKQILSYARYVAIIITIITVIYGIIEGYGVGVDSGSFFSGFFYGAFIAFIGFCSAWVVGLFLSGFGELISNTQKLLTIAKNEQTVNQTIVNILTSMQASPATQDNDGFVHCPKCNIKQSSDRNFCNKCGTDLK